MHRQTHIRYIIKKLNKVITEQFKKLSISHCAEHTHNSRRDCEVPPLQDLMMLPDKNIAKVKFLSHSVTAQWQIGLMYQRP